MSTDSVSTGRGARPTSRMPYAELGMKREEYDRVREILGRRPTGSELAIYSVMWSEHCSYKSLQGAPEAVRHQGARVRGAARGHGRERRRGRHRRRLGGHLQDRVAQPPVLRRAAPGRRHRRRRDRARHHVDGRPPDRGHGLAALRRRRRRPTPAGCCPAWSRASATTATAWACPTSAARSSSTPATSATRWSTRSAWACCARTRSSSPSRPGPATRSCCSARRPAPTASAARRVLAQRDLRGRVAGQAARRAGRRPVHGEAAHRVLPGAVRGRRGRGHPGPRRGRRVLRDDRAGRQGHRRHARRPRPGPAARSHAAARGDPDERVAGADDGRRHPRDIARVHGDLREVGRPGHRDRRGDRHRPAGA